MLHRLKSKGTFVQEEVIEQNSDDITETKK